jgi:hypothetical protein
MSRNKDGVVQRLMGQGGGEMGMGMRNDGKK